MYFFFRRRFDVFKTLKDIKIQIEYRFLFIGIYGQSSKKSECL